jgi:hypothetical protein
VALEAFQFLEGLSPIGDALRARPRGFAEIHRLRLGGLEEAGEGLDVCDQIGSLPLAEPALPFRHGGARHPVLDHPHHIGISRE